jgi:hypothetical protein
MKNTHSIVMRCVAAAALLLLGLAPGRAAAQSPLQAGVGGGFESYVFADPEQVGIESISLVTVPFAAEARLGGRILLGAGGALARGTLMRPDGSESRLEGLTDTELRATLLPFGGDRLSLTGVLLLATGESSLEPEEVEVAGAIAADLLPFRISNWGSGGGAAVAAAIAQPLGFVNAGVSVGYRMAGEFEPIDEPTAAYRPGNELRVQVALDRSFANGTKMALQGTLFTYQDDEFAGANLYRSGDRYQALASWAIPAGSGSAVLYVGGLHRTESDANPDGEDGLAGAFRPTPSQTLLMFGTAARIPMGGIRLLPVADVRLFRREDGIGQGWLAGAGASVEWPGGSGRAAALVPSVRVRYGNLTVSDDAESTVTGIDVGVTLRLGESRP